MKKSFKTFFRKIVDFLVPPLCLVCEEPISEAHNVCPACWKKLHFIEAPFCAKCGAPFDLPVEEGTLCASCLKEMPVYEAARSVLIYDDVSKPLLLGFKHGDRTYYAPSLAVWLARVGQPFLREADLLVPVPLHRWRLFKRRYNQSALLAQELSKKTSVLCDLDLLRRHRATISQGKMKKEERQKNVAGAFTLREGTNIEGLHIVLIDDVLTTGATVNECARVLYAHGAKRVDVLTFAQAHLAR